MSDKNNLRSSGVPMVRIDGPMVRRLREELGLTQLYVATAVEVTTETISRWENRRYPTLKRENGLRLAEVLGVELETILVADEEEPSDQAAVDRPAATRLGIPIKTYHLLINIALAVMIPLVIALAVWKNPASPPVAEVEATRVLPVSCAPGLAFPVVVRIADKQEVPLLVRETVPGETALVAAFPPATSREGDVLKWLRKDGGKVRDVGYLLRPAGKEGTTIVFSGRVTLRQGQQENISINGADSVRLAPFHWADTNEDFRISDDEILEMYDKFGGLPGLAATLDSVEEIWMGSGYRWNPKNNTIEILP